MDADSKKEKRKSVPSASISSGKTETLKTQMEMLEFGSLIAEDIGANQENNITGKWIAHYLVEKIEAAKSDPAVESECADLILKLWNSRKRFPSGDPLGSYEKLLKGLKELFPAEPRISIAGYSPRLRKGSPEEKWLQIACEINRQSRCLIATAVKEAVKCTKAENDELISMAAKLAPDLQTEALMELKFIAAGDEAKAEKTNNADDSVARAMERLKKAMDRYKKMSKG